MHFAINKHASVNSYSGKQNEWGSCSWNIRFIFANNDWELELVDFVFNTLYSNIPSGA